MGMMDKMWAAVCARRGMPIRPPQTEGERMVFNDIVRAVWRATIQTCTPRLRDLTARQDNLLTVVLCRQAFALFGDRLPRGVQCHTTTVLTGLRHIANEYAVDPVSSSVIDHLLRVATVVGCRSAGRLAVIYNTCVGGGRPAVLAVQLFDELQVPPADWLYGVMTAVYPVWAFDPAWRTDATVGLAGQAYDRENWQVMPILADALEDAGCDDQRVLAYLRVDGPFFRGCRILDDLLNKR